MYIEYNFCLNCSKPLISQSERREGVCSQHSANPNRRPIKTSTSFAELAENHFAKSQPEVTFL